MPKKKILLINHEESLTGAPILFLNLCKMLKDEFELILLSKQQGLMHEKFVQTFDRIVYTYTDENFKINDEKSLIARLKPDLVYANTIITHKHAVAAKSLGIPTIYHIHEPPSTFYLNLSQRELWNFNMSADLFIACSEYVYKHLIRFMGCLPSQVKLVYEFVPVDEIIRLSKQNEQGIFKKTLEKKRNEKIVMMVGTANKRKGIDIFIKAYNLLQKKYKQHFKFIWAGPYNKMALSVRYKEITKLDNNFNFLGPQENPYQFLKNADIFVLPSREDPFPLVVLEAMALEKPIIAFKKSGGVAEALSDSCGMLLNKISHRSLAKAIFTLSKDEKLMDRLIENAREKVKRNYDAAIIIPKIISLFRQQVDKKDNNKDAVKYNKILMARQIICLCRRILSYWPLIFRNKIMKPFYKLLCGARP